MSNILDLFDPDNLPNRPFERTIQPDEPGTLFRDLRDYVLPPEVRMWLTDQPSGFIQQYLASVNGAPDAICTWITGFFGSGKSHLLKVLAHLLCNTPIRDESGASLGATTFLCNRFGLGNLATLITGQLQGRPLVIQMLSYARSEGRAAPQSSISHIILSHLERSLGRSAVPWVAHFEQLFEKHGQFDLFRKFVSDTTAGDGHRQEWDEIKHDDYRAHPLLVQGLARFLPRTHKTLDIAQETVRLAENNTPAPESVIRRLVDESRAIHPHKGRLVVCLDEVRLYLGDNMDRITELQVLAEKVKSLGQGKVFLVVTGQESPEEVDSRFHQPGAGIGILADRFVEKFRLSESNIDYVVGQRLLRKSADSKPVQDLRKSISLDRPQLATAACIRNALQNPSGRFTNTEPGDLERYYPLLPYHVLLLQEILTQLRRTGPSGGVVGTKERAILIIIRALFGEPGHLLLGAAPVGTLVTFDRVYDMVEEELKGIHLNQRDQITQLQSGNAAEADWLVAVAKAVLLVQQAAKRYFRVTEEVVAAVLYPSLGADPNAHLSRVKDALKRLSETGLRYLTQDSDLGYRFLSETETRFEKVVAEQDVTDADRFDVLQEGAEAALKKRFFKYEYSGKHGKRKFELKVTLAGPGRPPAVLASGQHLELQFLTPAFTAADSHWADTALVESTTAPQRIVWAIKDLGRLSEIVERIVRVRKALGDARLKTTDAREQEQIETQRQKVERQAHDDEPGSLPSEILQGLSRGELVWNGDKKDLVGIPLAEDVFNDVVSKALKAVFTQFDHGSAVVVDADLRDVLTWSNTRPKCVEKLELMDGAGKLLLDRPVLKAITDLLRRADHAAEDKRKGEALAADFDSKPFGWDEHVVRAALAALLRSGAVVVHEGATQMRTPTDPKAIEVFSGWNRFKKAVFEYVGELTPAQRQTATQALHTLFDRAGEDTFEKIDRALTTILAEWRPQVAELAEVARAIPLPCLTTLQDLRSALQAIHDAPAGTQRIQVFLQPARQTLLARTVPAFKALRDFRVSGSLDQFQKIRNFVTFPATPFVQRMGGPLTAHLDTLRGNLGHEEFYSGSRWSSITQAHESLRQRYVDDYRQAHKERNESAAAAVAALQGHRNWNRLPGDKQQALVAPFAGHRCDADPAPLDEGTQFVCSACRTGSESLSHQLVTLANQRAVALASLDALDRPPDPQPGPGGDTVVFANGLAIASADAIAPLADNLRQALAEAMEKGQVTVDIRIHTRPKGRS